MPARPINNIDKIPDHTIIEEPVVKVAADASRKKPKSK
jgi:hypothetical protein